MGAGAADKIDPHGIASKGEVTRFGPRDFEATSFGEQDGIEAPSGIEPRCQVRPGPAPSSDRRGSRNT